MYLGKGLVFFNRNRNN
jgi:hypothetical protein